MQDSTEIGGKARRFPTTQWNLIDALRSCTPEIKRQLLDGLIARYWKPVYYFVRSRGSANEEAKDIVQGFFADWVERESFAQADAARGRFRTFLLSSLSNYMSNVRRAELAQRRHPPAGIVSLDELMDSDGVPFEPVQHETPEDAFNRAWVHDLLMRVLRSLEDECAATGKQAHYEIFRRRIIEPALEGVSVPPMRELADALDMTEKQAANCLLTARRAYQRLLRDEIRAFALSAEDVAAEVGDLFRFVTMPAGLGGSDR